MAGHKKNVELANHLAAGKTVSIGGVVYSDPAKLPTDAQLDAVEAANLNARLADIDAQIAALTARRAVIAGGGQ